MDNYKKIKNILDEKLKNKYFNNTICLATKERQETAKDLSSEVDCMIVVGGRHSSNTTKLVDICKENASTFAIETKDELKNIDLSNFNVVGITAGASTPDWIIQEVIEYINNL
jgi:4-hydroxy-3-methylbut-2-enyl diphosphate reductase